MKRFIAIITIWFLPVFVFADNEVTIPNDTTLILPTDGSQYTLKQSSRFDAMNVNSTTFTFTLSRGGRVTMISSGRKKLDHNAAAPAKGTFSCGTDQSQLDLSIDEPFTATTVTVTPSGTCSTGAGGGGGGGGGTIGGGGGGGGGGGTSPAPASQTTDNVMALREQIAAVQAKINQKLIAEKNQGKSGATPSAFGVFVKDLAPGTRGEEVKRLQELLARDKDIYPEGLTTGLFGPATARAVKKFQAKYGLPQAGKVGPQTRKKLEELFSGGKEAPANVQTVSPAPLPASAVSPAPAAPGATPGQIQTIQDQIKAIQAKLLQQQIKLIQEKIDALKK